MQKLAPNFNSHRFCLAPMLDWTDRHFRFFFRLISQYTRLYTEMLTAPAILHGHRDALLSFHPNEHPIACQLGGSDPQQLAQAAAIVADYGYDEINLNIGCPSDRVQKGAFGACLMAEPHRVADCVAAIKARTTLPVTIKTRIGIDDQDSDAFLFKFVDITHQAGCDIYIIHARKAWLTGLSPKENRTKPPLNYQRVYQLKHHAPDCRIILNGGLNHMNDLSTPLQKLDGCMVGRAGYHTPYLFTDIDSELFASTQTKMSRDEILTLYLKYCEQLILQTKTPKPGLVKRLSLPLYNLYKGCRGGKKWRRYLSEHIRHHSTDLEIIHQAKAEMNI